MTKLKIKNQKSKVKQGEVGTVLMMVALVVMTIIGLSSQEFLSSKKVTSTKAQVNDYDCGSSYFNEPNPNFCGGLACGKTSFWASGRCFRCVGPGSIRQNNDFPSNSSRPQVSYPANMEIDLVECCGEHQPEMEKNGKGEVCPGSAVTRTPNEADSRVEVTDLCKEVGGNCLKSSQCGNAVNNNEDANNYCDGLGSEGEYVCCGEGNEGNNQTITNSLRICSDTYTNATCLFGNNNNSSGPAVCNDRTEDSVIGCSPLPSASECNAFTTIHQCFAARSKCAWISPSGPCVNKTPPTGGDFACGLKKCGENLTCTFYDKYNCYAECRQGYNIKCASNTKPNEQWACCKEKVAEGSNVIAPSNETSIPAPPFSLNPIPMVVNLNAPINIPIILDNTQTLRCRVLNNSEYMLRIASSLSPCDDQENLIEDINGYKCCL
ncbi:MAG: hypothetical protein AAB437_03365 [Patescibacteria group bacterium]